MVLRKEMKIKKILFCTIGAGIGDTVVISFVPRELKHLFPTAHLTMVSTAPSQMWQHNPYIDQFISMPTKTFFRKLKSVYLGLVFWLKRYDIVIAIGADKQNKFFRFLSPKKLLILALEKTNEEQEIVFLQHGKMIHKEVVSGHTSNMMKQVLIFLGLSSPNIKYELFFANGKQTAVEEFLRRYHLINTQFLIFNPIGSTESRTVSKNQIKLILESCGRILPKSCSIILLDYKNQYQQMDPLCIRYVSNNIMDTAKLISCSAGVLSVDTGTVHLADLYNKPIIELCTLNYRPGFACTARGLEHWKPVFSKTQRLIGKTSVNDILIDDIAHAVSQWWKNLEMPSSIEQEILPLISVIVPVYKTEQYLPQCIESILAQTYKNLEIILIDDGSPDNCGAICDKYAAQDKRIVVIHKENGGVSSARNAGLKIAKGEYIGFVDSDDYIAPDMYEYLYGLIAREDADVSMCNLYQEINQQWIEFPQVNTENMILTDYHVFELKNWSFIWTKLYRHSVLKNSYFNEILSLGEDEYFLFQIFKESYRTIVVGNQPKYFYRCVSSGAIHSFKKNHLNYLAIEQQFLCFSLQHQLIMFYNKIYYSCLVFVSAWMGWLSLEENPDKESVQILQSYCRCNLWGLLKHKDIKFSKKCFLLVACINFNVASKLAKKLYSKK